MGSSRQEKTDLKLLRTGNYNLTKEIHIRAKMYTYNVLSQ